MSRDASEDDTPGALLCDREIAAKIGVQVLAAPGARAISASQVQPASLDLRLGARAWRMSAGFLPSATSVAERIEELALEELALDGRGAVLARGSVYLAELDEELALEPALRARFNPRSSTGRCDVFTRVLCAGHPRFDDAPAGYRGRLWLEIAPLSFAVRLARGDRLCQMRLGRGDAALSASELAALHDALPLCSSDDGELHIDGNGDACLRVGLDGRDPVAWRARATATVLEFGRDGAHAHTDFFEPIHARRGARHGARRGRVVLEPGGFYVFASRERVCVPPGYAAEMVPVDVGLGELRNNYAGFFDPGFGWRPPARRARDESARGARDPSALGTCAVLEVRAHDVPFLVEEGQAFARLRYFRTAGPPDRVYGEGRASYKDQDLTLARCFRGAP